MDRIKSRFAATAALAGLLGAGACNDQQPLGPDADLFAARAGAALALTASALAPDRIALTWTDNATSELGWQIHRSTSGPAGAFSLLGTTGSNITAFNDAGLTPLSEYCYKVRSLRMTGRKTSYSNFSAVACATTPALPPPTGTDAAPSGSSRTLVTWADSARIATSFRLERSFDAGTTWATVATVDSSQRHYFDYGVTAEQRVCYRVYAVRQAVESAASNTDCATPPAAPSSLALVGDTSGLVLTWVDNSAVEEGYGVSLWFFSLWDGMYFSVHKADLPPDATRFVDYQQFGEVCDAVYYVWAYKDGGTSDRGEAWLGPACGAGNAGGARRADRAAGGATQLRARRTP